jgi:nanoRNase/pAp phosphatase (c-di-AMP/oligoRNAs hydrolase)
MNHKTDFDKIKDFVNKAKDILIVTHERPTADAIGSSLALYLGLITLGKKVTIACPDPMTVELSGFVGVNKITQEIGKKNFIISLDYVEGSIEKVSYNIEGNKFNLVIEPREGYDVFSQDKVHFTTGGTSADVIFTIDTIHLGGLKKLYESDKDLFASKPIINVDRHPNNSNFGQINIVDPQASSTAEIVYSLLGSLGVILSQDIATNLLNAVYAATNSFNNQNVTPQAFELAAVAMKAGARRFRRGGQPQQISEELPKEERAVTSSLEHAVQTQPVPPEQKKAQEAPADWLKPKIFKSSNLG